MIKEIVKLLDEKKGENITIYDVSKSSPLCDYIVICTASNQKHIQALINSLEDKLNGLGYDIKKPEGKNTEWALLDAKEVIVHLFTEKERLNYNLDDLLKSTPTLDAKQILNNN